MAAVTADCDRLRLAAASDTFPASAVAMKYWICFSDTSIEISAISQQDFLFYNSLGFGKSDRREWDRAADRAAASCGTIPLVLGR